MGRQLADSAEVMPVDDHRAPSSPASTLAPASRRTAAKLGAVGVTTRTVSAGALGGELPTLVSAMSWPRPMTTSRSAVSDISLIRWLETNTVRPSAARPRSRCRTQRMPFGVEPVDRLVEQQHPGVAEQRAGDAEALAHPERELAGSLVGDRR